MFLFHWISSIDHRSLYKQQVFSTCDWLLFLFTIITLRSLMTKLQRIYDKVMTILLKFIIRFFENRAPVFYISFVFLLLKSKRPATVVCWLRTDLQLVSELKLAVFSCQVDGLIVTIWHYQFFNNLHSDRRSEPNSAHHYSVAIFFTGQFACKSTGGQSGDRLVNSQTSELTYSEFCWITEKIIMYSYAKHKP